MTDEQQHEYWLAAQKNKMDKMPPKNFASYIKYQASQVPSNEIHGNSIYNLFAIDSVITRVSFNIFPMIRLCLTAEDSSQLYGPSYLGLFVPNMAFNMVDLCYDGEG